MRTPGDPAAMVTGIERIARQLHPNASLHNVATMEQLVANSVASPRLYSVLLGLFAGIAAALAAIGVYGVVAYSVGQRTREIGIRLALGARRSQVLRLVLRQTAVVSGAGILAGVAGAAALTQYLEGMLFGVTPLDGATFWVWERCSAYLQRSQRWSRRAGRRGSRRWWRCGASEVGRVAATRPASLS